MENKLNVKIERLPKSIVKVTILPGKEEADKALDKAYTKLSKNTLIPGFRKGMAPKNLVLQQIETKLPTEAFNILIQELTQRALEQEKLNPISSPEFIYEPNDKDNPFKFSIKFAVYPDIKVGDLKEIKVDPKKIEQADQLRKDLKDPKKEINQKEKKSDEEKSEEVKAKKKAKEGKSSNLKEEFDINQYYHNIFEEVFKISTLDIPDVFIESELTEQENRFNEKLSSLGLKTEDYLKVQNKTIEDIRKLWKEDIEYKLKQDLILAEYINRKEIKTTKEEAEKALKEAFPQMDIEKLDKSYYNQAMYAINMQKAFNSLINFIEKNNASTNSN